jgi:hypothetical protein
MFHRLTLTASVALALVACGNDNGTGSSGGTSSSMSATVDGHAFNPPSTAITATKTGNAVTFTGVATSGGTTITVTIALPNVTVPGTLILNPTLASQSGRVTISEGSASTTGTWTTSLSPGNGSVTLTAVAASRVAGTFQFTGQFEPGSAVTGQVSVTSGSFDIRF